jgi:TRAP transporter TAXI family solute receptor
MRRVASGRADMGFTQADTAAKEAGGKTDVVALARLYDDYLHLVVPQESPVQTLAQLRGNTVAIGDIGSGTLDTVLRLFDVAGIDPDRDVVARRIGPQDAAAALRDGKIDAFFYSVGLPAGTVLTLGGWIPIRLVGLAGYAAALRKKHGPWYAEHTVPRSTYSMSEPAVTVGVPNYLVVAATMPEATAYALTGALFTGRATLGDKHPAGDRLNERDAINTAPLQLHPGAQRWYREHKL